jgi:hypothetical protein
MKRIDILLDDVLLEIFYFYVDMYSAGIGKTGTETWQSLVHVCRRWRSLVFRSPRRLKLQLFCKPYTPAKDTLDVWPALPLIVQGNMTLSSDTDNIIAALGQSNRVCRVRLWDFSHWQLEEVWAAMQVPFPELTYLSLYMTRAPYYRTLPVVPIPDSFLGGSAPRLQYFSLSGIPFLGFSKLLLSANHLVCLNLFNIPHSGYISPEAIVALLRALSSLKQLILKFRSPQSRPDWESRSLPPPKLSIIPALKDFRFKGVTEYLEDLVPFIDAPQLNRFHITFFNQIHFDCPRLAQFINRAPSLGALHEAHVKFNDRSANVTLRSRTPRSSHNDLAISILCRESDWQLYLSSIGQVCNSSLLPSSTIEDLYIEHQYWEQIWNDGAIENTLWLQLLPRFTAVTNLYLSKTLAPDIAAALQELVGGRIAEVLPSLQNIFVEGLEPSGPFQESIGQFVTARQLCGHPVAISIWNEEEESALSCMHSTLASIGREADIVCVRSEEKLRTKLARIFWVYIHELGIAAEFDLSSLSVRKSLLKGKRNAKGPKCSVNLNPSQHLCLNDILATVSYSTVMMSVVSLALL